MVHLSLPAAYGREEYRPWATFLPTYSCIVDSDSPAISPTDPPPLWSGRPCPQPEFGEDGEGALGADEEAREVVPRRGLPRPAPGPDH